MKGVFDPVLRCKRDPRCSRQSHIGLRFLRAVGALSGVVKSVGDPLKTTKFYNLPPPIMSAVVKTMRRTKPNHRRSAMRAVRTGVEVSISYMFATHDLMIAIIHRCQLVSFMLHPMNADGTPLFGKAMHFDHLCKMVRRTSNGKQQLAPSPYLDVAYDEFQKSEILNLTPKVIHGILCSNALIRCTSQVVLP